MNKEMVLKMEEFINKKIAHVKKAHEDNNLEFTTEKETIVVDAVTNIFNANHTYGWFAKEVGSGIALPEFNKKFANEVQTLAVERGLA